MYPFKLHLPHRANLSYINGCNILVSVALRLVPVSQLMTVILFVPAPPLCLRRSSLTMGSVKHNAAVQQKIVQHHVGAAVPGKGRNCLKH